MRILPENIKNIVNNNRQNLEQIRLRINKPLIIKQKYEIVTDYLVTKEDIRYIYEFACGHSSYAYEEELSNGYITLSGGHRIGFAGKMVTNNNIVTGMRDIGFINIRVAHEVTGCSDKIFEKLTDGRSLMNTLIISSPGTGKTTLLRDIIRNVSDRLKQNVGLVDERSEIAACYQGIPQNNVGIRTDIYDSSPKPEGMIRLVRTMAPDVIAVDEIGSKEDYKAVEYALSSGCKVIASVHGDECNDFFKCHFERMVLIEVDKKRKYSIFDGQGKCIYVTD